MGRHTCSWNVEELPEVRHIKRYLIVTGLTEYKKEFRCYCRGSGESFENSGGGVIITSFLLERFSDHSVENGLARGSLELGRPGGNAIAVILVHSCDYVLSTNCESGAVLGIGGIVVNEVDVIPVLMNLRE